MTDSLSLWTVCAVMLQDTVDLFYVCSLAAGEAAAPQQCGLNTEYCGHCASSCCFRHNSPGNKPGLFMNLM